MKTYTVMCKFGNKDGDKPYAFLTYQQAISPGQQVVVDLGTRCKIVTAVSEPSEDIDPLAKSWVVTPIDMIHHKVMVDILQSDNVDGDPGSGVG